MDLLGYLRYLYRSRRTEPRRYTNLFKVIFENRCRRILEIGTYDGVHAVQMIQTAGIFYPRRQIEYVGFDLFELFVEEKEKEEFCPFHHPPPLAEVQKRLSRTGAKITLYQGDTRATLPRLKGGLGLFDFIFIDGGHSVETVASDWSSVKELMDAGTIVLFDDYYTNPSPQLTGVGCQELVDQLDRGVYDVQLLEPDRFVKEWGALEINFVKVHKKQILTSKISLCKS